MKCNNLNCPEYDIGPFGEAFCWRDGVCADLNPAEERMLNDYKDSITNLKDLLEFPVTHDFSYDEGGQVVVKAYVDRVRELTGIEIRFEEVK